MRKTLKGLLATAGVAAAMASAPAHAANVPCPPGSTLDKCYFGIAAGDDTGFTDWKVGTLSLGAGLWDLTGYFDAIGASDLSVSLVGATTLTDGPAGGISFASVAGGDYAVRISGDFTFPTFFGTHLALYGAGFDIKSAVPEPETYALLLAGLLAIGYVASRRKPD